MGDGVQRRVSAATDESILDEDEQEAICQQLAEDGAQHERRFR